MSFLHIQINIVYELEIQLKKMFNSWPISKTKAG